MTDIDQDWVLHPRHYNTPSGIECIDIIRTLPHGLATATKYVWRFNDKWNPQEDLEKATFYLNDYIDYTFKSKLTDQAFHKQTVLGASLVMNTKLRDSFRTHIVYLEAKGCDSVAYFNLLYDFLRLAAVHEEVSYVKIEAVRQSLEALLSRSKGESTSPNNEATTSTESDEDEMELDAAIAELKAASEALEEDR